MNSSIFSSEQVRRYWRRPSRDHRWNLLLLVAGALVLWSGSHVLERIFCPPVLRTPDARVLFVGTSHVTRGIDLGSLRTKAAKLELAGLDLAVAERALSKHLGRWPNLELVLIELDEFSLLSDTVHGYQRNLSEVCGRLSLNAWELPSHPDAPLRDYQRIASLWSGRGYSSLWKRKRLTIENVAIARSTTPPSRPQEQYQPTNEGARARVAYAEHTLFANAERSNLKRYNLPALLRMIRTLRTHGVAVRLVRFPITEVYRAARPDRWQDGIDVALRAVRAEFPDCELWDFSSDARFSDADFKDVDHLGVEAARRLTRIVQEKIDSVLPRRSPRTP